MSTQSDALGTAMDAAITALSASDQAIALKCWQAIALPIIDPGASGVTTSSPTWKKITKTYADFSTAAPNRNIVIYTLPAGGVIHMVKTKHSVAFSGGAIATYTVSVGITGTLTKYATAFDVFQAVGGTVYQLSSLVGGESQSTNASIRAEAICTGANLNAATTGSVDFWILASVAT